MFRNPLANSNSKPNTVNNSNNKLPNNSNTNNQSASSKTMSRNPSIFIRLPNLGPHKPMVQKWTVSDITGIIDGEDFGEIREVSVRFDNHGEQFAVIHFERWFRGAEETAELLYGGGEVKIGAKYGKHFALRMFRMPVKPSEPRPRKTAKQDVPKPVAPKPVAPKSVAPKSVNNAPRPMPFSFDAPESHLLKNSYLLPSFTSYSKSVNPIVTEHDYGRFASKSVPNFLPPQPQQYIRVEYYPTNTSAMAKRKIEHPDVDMEEGEL